MAFLFRIAKYTFHQVIVTIGGVNKNLVTASGDTILISN
jgi:hypothetical protein